MGLIDDINPIKAWELASAENRISDRSTWPIAETGRARIQIISPEPKARITLGYPADDFGYPGLSMQAEHYFFLDIGGRARMQFAMPVTWVAQKQWYQYVGREIAMGGGSNAIFAVANRLILSAGGGASASPVKDSGEMLPDGTWNPTDMNEILDAAHWGLREYDEKTNATERTHQERLGYAVPVLAPAEPPKLSKFVALLGGATPTPTEHSRRIARLLDLKSSYVSNLLEKTSRITDGATKLMSNPAAIPFANVVFQKIDLLKDANGSLRELMTAPQVATASRGLGVWNKEGNQNDWDAMQSWLAIFADFANHIARVKKAAKELLVSVSNILGLVEPSPSVLGLVGRDGVSLVTHDDIFGWAPNGFRFVGAKNAEDYPVDPVTRLMRLARKKEEQVKDKLASKGILGELGANLLFGKDAPRRQSSDPSFRVLMDNDVELRGGNDVTIAAWGPSGRLRAEATHAAELASPGAVGIASRHAGVEVLGRQVAIGVPTKAEAKGAAQALVALASKEIAVQALRETHRRNADELIAARRNLALVEKTYRDKLRELQSAGIGVAAKAAAMQALTLEEDVAHTAATTRRLAARRASDLSAGATDAADAELLVMRRSAGATLTASGTAAAMGWAPAQQDVAVNVEMNARDEIAIYSGKTLSIEAATALSITTESISAPIEKATIKVEKEIELHVGNFKVTVAKDRVVVNNGTGDVLIIDADGAVMKTPQGAKVSVQKTDVSLDAVNNASITAKGRVLLG